MKKLEAKETAEQVAVASARLLENEELALEERRSLLLKLLRSPAATDTAILSNLARVAYRVGEGEIGDAIVSSLLDGMCFPRVFEVAKYMEARGLSGQKRDHGSILSELRRHGFILAEADHIQSAYGGGNRFVRALGKFKISFLLLKGIAILVFKPDDPRVQAK